MRRLCSPWLDWWLPLRHIPTKRGVAAMALFLTQGETIPDWESFSLAGRQQVIELLAQAALHSVRWPRCPLPIPEAGHASQDHPRPSDSAGNCLRAPIDPETGARKHPEHRAPVRLGAKGRRVWLG